MKKNIIALLLTIFCLTGHAQMEMGSWKTMFAYNGISKIVQTKDKIYALSNGNLYSVDKKYKSIETYSKITGLSDGEIQEFGYNKDCDMLLICYSNLNIDIIKEDKIYNISDLQRKEISNKQLNSINFDKNKAYLSCGFGVVEVNMSKKEIGNTFILGERGSYESIDQTIVVGDTIYALSANSILCANINDRNINNYNIWKKTNVPEEVYEKQNLLYFAGKLQLFRNKWYTYDNGEWKVSEYSALYNLKNIFADDDKMTMTSGREGFAAVVNKDLSIDTIIWKKNISDVLYDKANDTYWVAADSLSIEKKGEGQIDIFCPEGPVYNDVSLLKYDHGKIISAFGQDYMASGVVQLYEDGEWTNLTRTNIGNKFQADEKFYAIWDVALDPQDTRRMYVATWRSLFEFYDNKLVNRYFSSNTTLEQWPVDSAIVLLDALMFDKDNNLWISNVEAGNVIKAKDAEGKWHNVTYTGMYNKKNAHPFMQSSNGLKWLIFQAGGSGVFVFDENGTPFRTSDDKYRFMNSFTLNDGSVVTPTYYKSIAEDQNHDIWIGTDVGPIILKNTNKIFDEGYTATRIKITREDINTLADYLLATEQINAIVVDGANRKWIGTASSGVYLLSEDGQKTIHHFTTSNSPLTTNKINGLALDPRDGVLYIATQNGMFAYQTNSTNGKKNLNNIHVYPNPVRPGYDGLITVSGLMKDCEIRISDLQGNIITHGKSNGGTYTWDGKLSNGSRAATGVYFVFAITEDGENKNVAKFAIVKR